MFADSSFSPFNKQIFFLFFFFQFVTDLIAKAVLCKQSTEVISLFDRFIDM